MFALFTRVSTTESIFFLRYKQATIVFNLYIESKGNVHFARYFNHVYKQQAKHEWKYETAWMIFNFKQAELTRVLQDLTILQRRRDW